MLAIILVTLLAAVTSFLCSLMEASLYSISKAKIERLRQAGHKSGERLHQLRQHVQDPISAILTLNTIANTVGATVAGALVAHHYNNTVVGVFSGLFTLIILFGSEIIPKTLGVNYASKVAPMLSLPMVAIINVLYPFVWTCRFITHKFHRESHGPKEEDILALTQLGAETGTLHESEAQWAINALKLNDVTAADLVTPRTVVYMLPADMTLHEVKSRSAEWLFSKAPVTEGSGGDKVIGVLDRREVFDWM
ncbi:DUF21 domain-containing protein, partial [Candidatus Sumerlaeota bacterium]|nr:DUF21 domain-containing protein [Candidatus Sumerlaeota bacterium]